MVKDEDKEVDDQCDQSRLMGMWVRSSHLLEVQERRQIPEGICEGNVLWWNADERKALRPRQHPPSPVFLTPFVTSPFVIHGKADRGNKLRDIGGGK